MGGHTHEGGQVGLGGHAAVDGVLAGHLGLLDDRGHGGSEGRGHVCGGCPRRCLMNLLMQRETENTIPIRVFATEYINFYNIFSNTMTKRRYILVFLLFNFITNNFLNNVASQC